MAGAWALPYLLATYAETLRAVVELAVRAEPDALVATQGHVLRVDDLLDTLVVEAGLHHLDLTVAAIAPPRPSTLGAVRVTLDGLFGRPGPPDWDDAAWARVATGRQPLTPEQAAQLGPDAARLPALS